MPPQTRAPSYCFFGAATDASLSATKNDSFYCSSHLYVEVDEQKDECDHVTGLEHQAAKRKPAGKNDCTQCVCDS